MPDDFSNPDWYRQAWQLIQEEANELKEDFQENIGDGWNAIQRVRHFDCEGEWVLYVQTALPAAAAALWLLLVPSIDEILENYLNPKSGRGGNRRGRRSRRRWQRTAPGARRLFWSRGIPDVDESIARWLPGGEAIRGRRVGPGERIFWTGIDVADRVLWYWLLTEAFDTFATTWQSEIQESGRCQTALPSRLAFSWLHSPAVGIGPLWQSASQLDITTQIKANAGATGSISPPNGFAWTGSCVLALEVRNAELNNEGPVTRQYTLIISAGDAERPTFIIHQESQDVITSAGGLSSVTFNVHLDLAGITGLTFRFERATIEANGGLINDRFEGQIKVNAQARPDNE